MSFRLIIFLLFSAVCLCVTSSMADSPDIGQGKVYFKDRISVNSQIGALNRSRLFLRHRQLGSFSLDIRRLDPHTRTVTLQSENQTKKSGKMLYLGNAVVNLRRGISVFDHNARHAAASVAARLSNTARDSRPYLKFRFIKQRKSGRIFEINIDLHDSAVRLRSVSLRALSGKGCGNPVNVRSLSYSGNNRQKLGPELYLHAELRSQIAAASSSKVFTVTTDCDAECYSKLGESEADDRILEFFNSASAIYESQFGYRLKVTNQVVRTSSSQYPASATDAETLLDLVQQQAPSLPSADMKHLITGKSMKDGVVGLSYVGVVCSQPSFSLGYSQHLSSLLTPVIIAHEIGHNFNATHDPDGQGIMTSRLSAPYPDSFSSFSRSEIQGHVNGLGSLICYDQSSGSNTDDAVTASFSTRFSKSRFSASINQTKGSDCSYSLRIARSEQGLSAAGSGLVSGVISTPGTVNLQALNMPQVKVASSAQKAIIWFDVVSSCSEGSAIAGPRKLNVAVLASRAKGKSTVSSTRRWIARLRQSIQAS